MSPVEGGWSKNLRDLFLFFPERAPHLVGGISPPQCLKFRQSGKRDHSVNRDLIELKIQTGPSTGNSGKLWIRVRERRPL